MHTVIFRGLANDAHDGIHKIACPRPQFLTMVTVLAALLLAAPSAAPTNESDWRLIVDPGIP